MEGGAGWWLFVHSPTTCLSSAFCFPWALCTCRGLKNSAMLAKAQPRGLFPFGPQWSFSQVNHADDVHTYNDDNDVHGDDNNNIDNSWPWLVGCLKDPMDCAYTPAVFVSLVIVLLVTLWVPLLSFGFDRLNSQLEASLVFFRLFPTTLVANDFIFENYFQHPSISFGVLNSFSWRTRPQPICCGLFSISYII